MAVGKTRVYLYRKGIIVFDIVETLIHLRGFWRYRGGRFLAKLPNGHVTNTYVRDNILMQQPDFMAGIVSNLLFNASLDIYKCHEDDNPFYTSFPHEPFNGRCLADLIMSDQIIDTTEHIVKLLENGLFSLFTTENLVVCACDHTNLIFAYEIARQLGAEATHTDPIYSVIYHPVDTSGITEEALQRNLQNIVGSLPVNMKHLKDVVYRAIHAQVTTSISKVGQRFHYPVTAQDSTVLFVDSVIQSGNLLRESMEAVYCKMLAQSPQTTFRFYPMVLCLFNLSNDDTLCADPTKERSEYNKDYQIVSLKDIETDVWPSVTDACRSLAVQKGGFASIECALDPTNECDWEILTACSNT